jgi:hypothetical protein
MFSAFTVAELGEMLRGGNWQVYKPFLAGDDSWMFQYRWREGKGSKKKHETITAGTEADARAKMLVYLLENKLITL